MNDALPRMRIFAGPNGSGKSTLKGVLPPQLLGAYLNPDDIERQIRSDGFFECRGTNLSVNPHDLLESLRSSPRLNSRDVALDFRSVKIDGPRIVFGELQISSYVAASLVDFLRAKLLAERESFTFETVMSHPDKVESLRTARRCGYRTYLYYVATDDPEINVSRVRARAAAGGHDVPYDKIVERYHRSLRLLMSAIRESNRAYLFDNSYFDPAGRHAWIAEITDGNRLELKSDYIPRWVKTYVLEQSAH